MKKTVIFNIIKPLSFLLAAALVLMGVSYLLAPKDGFEGSGISSPNARGFYSEPKNSIDIAVIGNSDAYSGFSPMELWNEYGYTSYVSGEGRQLVGGSIAMLERVLSCQSPKIVILETDGLFSKPDAVDAVAGIVNSASGSVFSVFQYHNRWKNLKLSEMFKPPYYSARCATKGQKISNDVVEYTGGEYMKECEKRADMPEYSRDGLKKFADMCKKAGAELILLEIPSASSWSYAKHNAVDDWAKENGVPFIDLNIDRDSFGFDWSADSRDGGNHLNIRGARKVTLHIGKYISENYEIKDRRGDEAFDIWNDDFKSYKKDIKI